MSATVAHFAHPVYFSAPMSGPVVQLEGVSKKYGALQALADVSFAAAPGEVVGFLGPNGAGKTTALRLICGYLTPSAGRVRVCGYDVEEQPIEARLRIGYMPESAPLYASMRVGEYLNFRAALKRVPRAAREQRVGDAARLTDVTDVMKRIIGQLSKGYQQRVALADALVADPEVLVLDEPTAGLDPNQARHFRTLIRDLSARKTIIISTHILSEVEAACDRAVIMHRGRLVADSTLAVLQGEGERLDAIFARLTGAEVERAEGKA